MENWPGQENGVMNRAGKRMNWPGQGTRELGMQEREPMSWPGQDTLELAKTENQNLPEGKQKAEQNIAHSRLEQTTGELGSSRTRGKLSRSFVQNCPASGTVS
jgi:hypothetical protein